MITFASSSRKASLKDKVFPSPSKAPLAKGKSQSPDGAEASPGKVDKSWSFADKNRGPKHSFRARGSTSRQNSEGEGASRRAAYSMLKGLLQLPLFLGVAPFAVEYVIYWWKTGGKSLKPTFKPSHNTLNSLQLFKGIALHFLGKMIMLSS